MVGFKYRNFVRLQGLKNAAYNGRLARICSFSADQNAGRYLVELQIDDEVAPHLNRDILVKSENMVRACDCCHHAGAATMQYCGRCKNAAYCNAECQRSDWTRHKVDCSAMNSQRQVCKSPIHLAVVMGNLAEVESLILEGADVNIALKEDDSTPLSIAAQQGNLSVVQFLIRKGADKNSASTNGCTPLYHYHYHYHPGPPTSPHLPLSHPTHYFFFASTRSFSLNHRATSHPLINRKNGSIVHATSPARFPHQSASSWDIPNMSALHHHTFACSGT